MNLQQLPLISIVLFLPLVGAVILLFVKKEDAELIKRFTLVWTIITFVLSLGFLIGFQYGDPGFQFTESLPWIPQLGIGYQVGLDGISLLLIILTTSLMPLAVLSSFKAITDRVKEYYIFMLLLEVGMLGVFVSLDLFLFYVFWEVTLVPMYFLIGIWGGKRRVYAAVKFFLYTMAGSLLMLLAILYLGINGGTFSLPTLLQNNAWLRGAPEMLLFIFFGIAFAIKVPMWPFHSWLPDAHVEAPTAGSVILAGVLLKMGTYGFLRFNLPLFPNASREAAPFIAIAGDHWHHLRRDRVVRANGREEVGRVLVGEPSRFCDAGHLRAESAGYSGRVVADDQSRHQHGRLVLAGGLHL